MAESGSALKILPVSRSPTSKVPSGRTASAVADGAEKRATSVTGASTTSGSSRWPGRP
ncbi:MAG: hypothetical protein IPH38_08535 [Candidatus Microthrix sp.]|nr:hypothetical protein [Candidatus Microthrix sp.]MBK7019625.1 hypothetical protein [Candidatus Microthrix sp.]